MAGIGHNSAAFEGRSWRRYAWGRARRELKPARVPLEIVRIRVRRAKTLGLTYPQYASILLGSGRDIVGFLFTVGGLQLRLMRELEAPEPVKTKLKFAPACKRLALSPPEEPLATFTEDLERALPDCIDVVALGPTDKATWSETRQILKDALTTAKLPADAVIMIGASADKTSAEAAFLAGFLESSAYFDNGAESGLGSS